MRQFLYKLIPPRPTFDQDMSASERAVMEQHFAYWGDLTEKKIAIVYGPVLDPNGVWGLAVIDVNDEPQALTVGRNDPAVRSGLSRFEIYPVQLVMRAATA